MKLVLCELLLFAVTTCSAQQSDLLAPKTHFVVTESKTLSVGELQQRNQSKARQTFSDAKLAAQKGAHLRAIKLFEKTLQRDPGFSDARNDLAVEFIVLGDLDHAVEQLEQAVHDPRFVMAYNNLAVVFCNQKKYADTEIVARQALNISPNSAKSSLLLAMALYHQGKRGAETQSALEMAARSNPIAIKLLKDWYGISDIASASELK